MKEFIQLEKDNILRIGIKDAKGNDTGEFLEFDMEDIELPLKFQECIEKHEKNIETLKIKLLALEKRQDTKLKGGFLSKNEKEGIELVKDFYNKEINSLDLFLGKGGTKKLLNGRKPYYTMFDDIQKVIEPIMPLIEENASNIKEKIINKYKSKAESNVI